MRPESWLSVGYSMLVKSKLLSSLRSLAMNNGTSMGQLKTSDVDDSQAKLD